MSEEPPKKLKRLTPQPDKGKTIRILYVEDAAVIRDTIAKLLELKGYKVGYANNGQEGVEMSLKWKPDVVLMDLRMPVMDGYKAINQIKLNPKTHHLPVFVMTFPVAATSQANIVHDIVLRRPSRHPKPGRYGYG